MLDVVLMHDKGVNDKRACVKRVSAARALPGRAARLAASAAKATAACQLRAPRRRSAASRSPAQICRAGVRALHAHRRASRAGARGAQGHPVGDPRERGPLPRSPRQPGRRYPAARRPGPPDLRQPRPSAACSVWSASDRARPPVSPIGSRPAMPCAPLAPGGALRQQRYVQEIETARGPRWFEWEEHAVPAQRDVGRRKCSVSAATSRSDAAPRPS